jgi:hypothetical protein
MSGQRTALTLATLLVVALLYLLMLRGWRSRQRRQGDLPPPPAAPASDGGVLAGATPGLFVGTTYTGAWLDRVAVHGLGHRAAGWLSVRADGVLIEREGMSDLHLPFQALLGAAPGTALAGKVMGPEGLLLLDWRLGEALLTSGFRGDDHAQHRRLADLITSRLAGDLTTRPAGEGARP